MNVQSILIRGGMVYAPEELGLKDILILGEQIALIGERIVPPPGVKTKIFDASGSIVVPGFIDLHVHLLGGGGEDGWASRVPEVSLSALTTAGITTAVGVLGTDSVTRTPEALLAKTKAIRAQGLSAYMYTGAYHLPSPTITGSVMRDISLIEEVIGVKIAISDHRSSQPTVHELARLASEARIGGMLGKKPGIVHAHVGPGVAGLSPILSVCEQSEIPIGQFLPTHVSRNLSLMQQGIDLIKQGGVIDLTVPSDPAEIVPLVHMLINSGIDMGKVTLSSDGNGSRPLFTDDGAFMGMGIGSVATIGQSLRKLVESHILPLTAALRLITANPAARLGLSTHKGSIQPGLDADVLVLDQDLQIDKVIARGRLMVAGGTPVVNGVYE